MPRLKLLALDDFEVGEAGVATSKGVRKPSDAQVPENAKLVTALENIRAGEIGTFHEWNTFNRQID